MVFIVLLVCAAVAERTTMPLTSKSTERAQQSKNKDGTTKSDPAND